MADTSRTLSQLKTLFADNVTGQISAQDLRDLVASVFQYGAIRMISTDTPSGQVIGTIYEKLTQFTKRSIPSADIASSLANENFTVARGGVFAMLVTLSFSGTNNSTWTGSLFKRGIDQEVCSFRRKLGSSKDIGFVSLFDCLVVSEGDVIDYRLKSDDEDNTFTLETGSFMVFRIG